MTPAIDIDLQITDTLAVSLLHIGVQQPRLFVTNRGDIPSDVVELEVRVPELSVRPSSVTIPALKPRQRVELEVPLSPTQWDRMRLLDLLHQQDGLSCMVKATLRGRLVAEQRIRVLPPNAWLHGESPAALAAFVDKESEAVQQIKVAARFHLQRHLGVSNFIHAGRHPLRDLKIRDEFERMTRISAAIYECLQQSHNIHYEAEPRTYPDDWQKIRFHDQVMNERQGTCIDLALLLAACLEEAFLNSVVMVFKTGPSTAHVIVGCWERDSEAASTITKDYERVDAWLGAPGRQNRRMLCWDATGCTAGRGWTFSQACEEGLTALRRAGRKNFMWAIDISRSRESGIFAWPVGMKGALSVEGWRVVREAEAIAKRYRFDLVEGASLLLALIEISADVAHDVFGQDATSRMKQAVERTLTKTSRGITGVRLLEWTRSAQGAREQARVLAEEHGAGLVGPVQLWQALVEAPSRTTKSAFKEANADLNEVRRKLIELAQADPQRVSYLTSGHFEP